MNITTMHDQKPIQVGDFDWEARESTSYDAEMFPLVGWGRTEKEAIADLMQQIEAADDRP